MLKIGITGKNGFIGSHLYNRISLFEKEFKLIDFKRRFFNNEIKLDEFVSSCDVIIHLAGINRHENDSYIFNKNIELTNNLINSFKRVKYNGRVIFSSSIQEERSNVFGESKKKSRMLFSDWANSCNGDFTALIIPNVFGAFGKPYYNSVISTFCYQINNNKDPVIENDVKLNLIYIDDLIFKIIYFIKTKSKEVIRISHNTEIKVTSILKKIENFKKNYILHGIIPNFDSKFELNLFNTFRSYIDLKSYYPKYYKNNIDSRGNFVEIIKLNSGGQISFSTTKKNITRGNHFHTRKIERFSVIKGEAVVKLRRKNSNDVFSFYLSGDKPSYIDMPIWFTHNITNTGNEDLYTIFWINEFYNENDPDTYFEKV